MKTKFLYHAEAVGASGHITLPFDEVIEIQASAALPISGGHGTSRSENFKHRNILSFHEAKAHVVGALSDKEKKHHATLSSVVITGLNVLDVVTCDRMVMRLTSQHDVGAQGEAAPEPSFKLHGTHFDNLRIAGHLIDVKLATGLFNKCDTWTGLSNSYANAAERKDLKPLTLLEREDDQLPESKGMLGFTFAQIPDPLPDGLTRDGHGIKVDHFGTVYIGELFISRYKRRVQMLHIELGCSVEGCVSLGSGEGNGLPWP